MPYMGGRERGEGRRGTGGRRTKFGIWPPSLTSSCYGLHPEIEEPTDRPDTVRHIGLEHETRVERGEGTGGQGRDEQRRYGAVKSSNSVRGQMAIPMSDGGVGRRRDC